MMASKKDFSKDALDAFDIERPIKAPPPGAPPPPPQEIKIHARETVEPVQERGELMRRTFYIKRSQYKALKLRAAESERPEEKDTSAIIRTAIDLYLAKK